MQFYRIDPAYLEYLKHYEKRLESNKLKYLRPYIGVVLTVHDGINYFAPLHSPKQKHYTMKNNLLDCIKIFGRKGNLLSVINLNNMIPVKEECLSPIIFKNESDPFLVQKFQNEYRIIKRLAPKICSNAKTLYHECQHHPDGFLAQRCYDFKLLEEKYRTYSKNQHISYLQSAEIDYIQDYCQAIVIQSQNKKECEIEK